jgi:hypothetical protein
MWLVGADAGRRSSPLLERTELFDHFIGAHQKGFGDREPKRIRSGEIDDKIELDGQFDRNVLGFDALDGKRQELLMEAVPTASKIAILADPTFTGDIASRMSEGSYHTRGNNICGQKADHRNSLGRLSCGKRGGITDAKNSVGVRLE